MKIHGAIPESLIEIREDYVPISSDGYEERIRKMGLKQLKEPVSKKKKGKKKGY